MGLRPTEVDENGLGAGAGGFGCPSTNRDRQGNMREALAEKKGLSGMFLRSGLPA
jgi:hypothetical protein